MDDKKYCNGCVNCIKVGNLNSDEIKWECEAGISSDDMKNIGKEYVFETNWKNGTWKIIGICNKFDSGSHKGENAEIFKDVIVCNHNVKRKIKAWDYYEGCWRA